MASKGDDRMAANATKGFKVLLKQAREEEKVGGNDQEFELSQKKTNRMMKKKKAEVREE